jgi:hypothetical protein
MHKTDAGEKRKALKGEALELARDAKAARKAAKTLSDAREKACDLEGQADSLKAEADELNAAARLEDLHSWQMDKVKTTKKGKTTYGYWMASWREGDKVRKGRR